MIVEAPPFANVYEGPTQTMAANLEGVLDIDLDAGCTVLLYPGDPPARIDLYFPPGTTVDMSDPENPVIEVGNDRLVDGQRVELGGGAVPKTWYEEGGKNPTWCVDDSTHVFVMSSGVK